MGSVPLNPSNLTPATSQIPRYTLEAEYHQSYACLVLLYVLYRVKRNLLSTRCLVTAVDPCSNEAETIRRPETASVK
jgi:hypothetical protein